MTLKIGGHYRPNGLAKVPYKRHEGRIRARQMGGRIYKCLECNNWHITTQKQHKRKSPLEIPLEGFEKV